MASSDHPVVGRAPLCFSNLYRFSKISSEIRKVGISGCKKNVRVTERFIDNRYKNSPKPDGRQAVKLEIRMNVDAKILKEIRRRAFDLCDQRSRDKETWQDIEDTIDALQELTGLPRLELETIAAGVRSLYEQEEADFFSVKNQFLMVFSGLALTALSFWALSRLII